MTIDIDERKVNRNEAGLWFGWVLATGVGMAVGFIPAGLLADWLGVGLASILSPILAGLLIWLGQWLVLRNFLTRCSDWIWAAGAAWGIGYAAGILVLNWLPAGAWIRIFGYSLFGAIVAIVQWPVLRREIPHIIPWILANIAGWTIGLLLGQASIPLFFSTLDLSPFLTAVISQSIAGLVSGAIIGLVLIWIVRKPDRVETAAVENARDFE